MSFNSPCFRSSATILADQNDTWLEITVPAGAEPNMRSDVFALGTALGGDNQRVASTDFRVDVRAGLFDLKAEPSLVKLAHGDSTKNGRRGP